MPAYMERREMTERLSVYIAKLDKSIKRKFSKDTAHDIYHLYRVYTLALKIQKKEGGDRLVIGVAAFLHDIHRMMQAETGKFCHPKDSLPIIKQLLTSVGFPKDKFARVLHVIEHHEEYSFSYNGRTVHDTETLIVQDADNLDAMGAIGIARTFAFSAQLKVPMWNPDIDKKTKHYDEHKTDKTVLDHFHNKLLRLKDTMSTKTAKSIAKGRHEYMKEYVDRFKKEWNGKL
jgi:uncharacterized protein